MTMLSTYGACRSTRGLRGIVQSVSTALPRDTGASDYATVLDLTKQHQDWVPRFAAAVASLGFTPQIDETYVPPGNNATEYWFYAVRWNTVTPDGTPAYCGIFVNDLYMGMDPLTLAKQITSNCIVDAGAAKSWATTPTAPNVEPTQAEYLASQAAAPTATAETIAASTIAAATAPAPTSAVTASIWDQLVSALTPTTADATVTPAATGLSSIPTWAWLVGGGLALYLFMGRGKS